VKGIAYCNWWKRGKEKLTENGGNRSVEVG